MQYLNLYDESACTNTKSQKQKDFHRIHSSFAQFKVAVEGTRSCLFHDDVFLHLLDWLNPITAISTHVTLHRYTRDCSSMYSIRKSIAGICVHVSFVS